MTNSEIKELVIKMVQLYPIVFKKEDENSYLAGAEKIECYGDGKTRDEAIKDCISELCDKIDSLIRSKGEIPYPDKKIISRVCCMQYVTNMIIPDKLNPGESYIGFSYDIFWEDGKINEGMKRLHNTYKAAGFNIVLWEADEGESLDKKIKALKDCGVSFDYINEIPGVTTRKLPFTYLYDTDHTIPGEFVVEVIDDKIRDLEGELKSAEKELGFKFVK